MIPVKYLPFTDLRPVQLSYSYFKDEKLNKSSITFANGLTFYSLQGTDSFQDIAINRNTGFILTSTVELKQVFTKENSLNIGKVPGSIYLQPSNYALYYIGFNDELNNLKLDLTPTQIYVSPIPETNEVELFMGGKYVQVNVNYPYELYLNDRSLDPESINRQRFILTYKDDTATLKTLTNTGYRYITVTTDNTIRATGLMLNNSVINNYLFRVVNISNNTVLKGFLPYNNFVTYFFDIENGENNKTLTVNKNVSSVPVNYLLSFPVDTAITTGKVNINIANLKTTTTPSGGIAPIDNSYPKT